MLLGLLAAAAAALAAGSGAAAPPADLARLQAEAAQVMILRDDWGVAHVHGHTDREAVFGMIYAQAEDDFARVEANYLTSLGRTAEAADAGPEAIWADLRQRLYVDPQDLQARYAAAPDWLKAVMEGWADGLNFYLATHPAVHPKVLTHFEPWMALSFTEGSIGGDIERIDLKALQAFYEQPHGILVSTAPPRPAPAPSVEDLRYREPTGSNGIAIAPKNTRDGHALLLINPHTSFYFRSELQMSSEEGLNVYGAATWGQPFVYQGFNEHLGFMHTSSGVDAVDEFAETMDVHHIGAAPDYRYGGGERAATVTPITISYRDAAGALAARTFTTYRTLHGPIVKEEGGKWIAFAMMYRPVEALSQSWLRTKAKSFAEFQATADRLKANSSNNTLFADDRGTIAYLHPQFIPRRDDRFDYQGVVDGSDPATAWKGDTPFEETPHLVNPPSGFVYNSNDEPWNAAGSASLNKAAYPKYMDQAGWNPRGPHALGVLTGRHDFTLKGLNEAAFDPYQPEFATLIPQLIAAYDLVSPEDPYKARLAQPVAALRGWDFRWGADSVATSLAVFYGEQLFAKAAPIAHQERRSAYAVMEASLPPPSRVIAFGAAVDRLTADFGGWNTPWGEINRYQRLDDSIAPHFDDGAPSIPIPFTSAQWGSLASFGARPYPNTKKYYGSSGNSFVAVVEFGPRVRAVTVTAGGESGDPSSPHFQDQNARYASGNFREVYFYPDQLKGHTERTYRPGE